MKTKVAKNRREGTEHLMVRTTKGEYLDYAQAELLRTVGIDGLLPFDYDEQRHGEVVFSYPITNMVPLETYLKAQLSLSQFRAMLDDVTGCFERCAANGLDPTRLLFDHALMRLDATSSRLRFAYLPAQGLPGDRDTAMDLLRFISEHALFVCDDNDADAVSLLDYLRRQTVFSAVEFRELLESTAFRTNAPAPQEAETSGTSGRTLVGAPRTAQDSTPSGPFSFAPTSRASAQDAAAPAAFDFVKAQAGAASAREVRASQSLAQQVAADVASVAARTATVAPPTPLVTEASSTSLLASNNLVKEPKQSSAAREETFYLVRTVDGARFPLAPGTSASLGRSKNCAIRVTGNPSLSRLHATITAGGGCCYLEDEESLNKTFVDNQELDPHVSTPLKRGDSFLLADEEFRLE